MWLDSTTLRQLAFLWEGHSKSLDNVSPLEAKLKYAVMPKIHCRRCCPHNCRAGTEKQTAPFGAANEVNIDYKNNWTGSDEVGNKWIEKLKRSGL